MSKVNVYFLYAVHKVLSFCSQHRSLVTALTSLVLIVSIDIGFHAYLTSPSGRVIQSALPSGTLLNTEGLRIDIGFAPEVWLSVLGLTLGTLIIIISIASQNIPKLIDLYMEDWISLFFVWFLVISSSHAIFTKFYNEIWATRTSSVVLNIHFFLPISIFLTLPYIFYVLKSTQPSDVIKKIFFAQLRKIHSLGKSNTRKLLVIQHYIDEVQVNLFKSLSQLDNLLEYVSFKEAKAQIIQDMGTLVQHYIEVKPQLSQNFFLVSSRIRDDISFRTMMGQFSEVERTRTFYEQKCFRLLGNTYIKLIEEKEFDLASLCCLEINRVGEVALTWGDDLLLGVIIIRFNTLLRFALKHGVKNNEARNLYNLIFHYRNFITNLVLYNKIQLAKQSFYYLRIYGTEIYRHGRISPSMYFIVDVFAAEMKEILIQVNEHGWSFDVQRELLEEMLLIDNPPDFTEGDLDRGQLLNNGVRILQIGLGLYYLRVGRLEFVYRIIADILDDLEVLGEAAFQRSIDLTCHRLELSSPNFWEDTDRGNLNLYYSPDRDQIDRFRAVLAEQMKTHIFMRGRRTDSSIGPIQHLE